MMELYNTILYQPLFNAVIFLYNILPGNDFGLAIIALTLAIRLVFFPLTVKTIRSQRALSRINPRMKEIKDKFKNDNQAQSAAIMKLYKDNNINPLSGCLPLLIQLPILIALYQAFGAGFKPENLELVYDFVGNPGYINPVSFGFLNITSRSIALALITGFFQYLQLSYNQKLMKASGGDAAGGQKEMQMLNSQMLYFFPIMIIVIGWNLPAGLLIYWLTTTLFSIGEQAYIKRRYKD
ncbi:MAG: YidC/Oxa1 family membrane protein insertase [Candidatus Taylorbacteria bacterium]|nr:YidC/Oxa1 family membrane protein insertase [Candidatus Taylorbacteria bacterium]